MDDKRPEDYNLNDFLLDDSFVNYHFERKDSDVNRWKTLLNRDPLLMEKANKAGSMLELLSMRLPEAEFQEEYQKLAGIISAEDSGDQPGEIKSIPVYAYRNRKKRVFAFMAAASAVLLVTFGLILHSASRTLPLQVVKNSQSGNMRVLLQDGTQVSLGPNSELDYDADFNKTDRKIHLKGNAGFHVKSDPNRPFKVSEGNLTATVLGTIFNIVDHSTDSSYSIELLQGSLKVDLADSKTSGSMTLYLKPHERAFYKESTGNFFKERWNVDTLISNPVNHIVFKNADFEMVAKRLKEVYGVTVLNQNGHKKWHFTAEFTNADIKEVLENICTVEGMKSKVQGDTVLLK